MMDALYKKRFGTSGISGQLYETKLISLILFRLLYDDRVEDCYLASNMDEIGSFDDICLKVKFVDQVRPIVLFIQVKHRDNDDKFLTLDNKNEAVKWSDSILKIKKKITSNKVTDKLFNGDIGVSEYLFILYTNANCEFDSHCEFKSDYASILNNLITTSSTFGSRPLYSEKDVEDLGEKILNEDIIILAERFGKFLGDKTNQAMSIMNDEYILRYHVLLANKVVNVSEIQNDTHSPELKWRTLTFRSDFFCTDDEYIMIFRNNLYEQILKNLVKTRRQNSQQEKKTQPPSPIPDPWIEELIALFLSDPSATTLSPLIEKYITCNKAGKLEFIFNRSVDEEKRLEQICISSLIIDKAKEIAAKTQLLFAALKVPVVFGNLDLAINGTPKKIERRLNHLTDFIVNLCQKFTEIESQYKVITIDDSIESGLLCSKGGLAAAVGNILDNDRDTKLLKFADNHYLLQNNAKSLYFKLKQKLDNFHEYRFDVKTLKFPKLSFDCANISREFLNKLIIYTKQSNHYDVEEILKKEIQQHLNTNTRHHSVQADNVFLYYHNSIQNWWMSPKTGLYLTKRSDIFEQAINNTVIEQKISALQNSFYMTNIKYFSYRFNVNALSSFKSLESCSKMIIYTDITTLTTMKVIQYLTNIYFNHKYAVLDFECILNLPTGEYYALEIELRKTEKVVIMVFDSIQHANCVHVRLNELALALKEKKVIVITNIYFKEVVKEYFPCADTISDLSQSLKALTSDSQKEIISNAKVTFQGQEVALCTLLDNESIPYIKGVVLKKILDNDTISLGTYLSNSSYEEIKHLYIDRRVSQATDYGYDETDYDNVRLVKTFHDIEDDTVLVTAAPGMGKSTLLTHLSLKTKERDSKFWIVRINLLDYSKEFYKWQEQSISFSTLEMFKFICQVILKSNDLSIDLKEFNNKLYLVNGLNDEWATFEINMFLHFYNEKHLILLFDGFDEICPHYKDSVIKLFEVVRKFPQKNKVWVTSRPYSEILPDLQRALGKSYKLEHMSDAEQVVYLKNIWRTKLVFGNLNDVQLQNVITYMTFISQIMSSSYAPDALHFRFRKIFFIFYDYIFSHFPHIDKNIEFPFYRNQFNVYYTLPEPSSTEAVFDKIAAGNQGVSAVSAEVDTLLGTPLLLYFIAEYFVSVIDFSKSVTEWQLGINILSIYEMFIESKLKKVLFQDKNKMDVFNPDVMTKFEKERNDCVAIHKKIAAYVLLGSPIFSGLNLDELKEMDPLKEGGLAEFEGIINTIKVGAEKTGLISHVTADNIPVFIHRTFTEYFAADFICDILKSNKFELHKKKLLYTTTYICHMNDVFPWINKKKEIDNDLSHIIKEIENANPLHLTWYRKFLDSAHLPLEQFIRIMNSCIDDYEGNYFNTYNEKYARTILYTEQPGNRDVLFKQFQMDMIAKMKPHLKQHFVPVSVVKRKNWLRRALSYNK